MKQFFVIVNEYGEFYNSALESFVDIIKEATQYPVEDKNSKKDIRNRLMKLDDGFYTVVKYFEV